MPGVTEVRVPEWQVGEITGNDIRGNGDGGLGGSLVATVTTGWEMTGNDIRANRGGIMPCGHCKDWEVILLL